MTAGRSLMQAHAEKNPALLPGCIRDPALVRHVDENGETDAMWVYECASSEPNRYFQVLMSASAFCTPASRVRRSLAMSMNVNPSRMRFLTMSRPRSGIP